MSIYLLVSVAYPISLTYADVGLDIALPTGVARSGLG